MRRTAAVPSPPPAAPVLRPFRAHVQDTLRLSPGFLRLTLRIDDPAPFAGCGDDQRVKLVLPAPGGSLADVPGGPDWFARCRALPDPLRPVLRTWTVRQTRPQRAEVDVDVVVHEGRQGPAAAWALTARPGAAACLVGPQTPGTGPAWGVEWCPPPQACALLLAGDETAVPAVSAVLEALPEAGPPVTAVLEVPYAGDRLPLQLPARVRLQWHVRGRRPHGSCLAPAVREALAGGDARAETRDVPDVDVDRALLWDGAVPDEERPRRAHAGPAGPGPGTGEPYVWLAGEAGVLKDLRRHLAHDLGLSRSSYAVMGYWRRGRAVD